MAAKKSGISEDRVFQLFERYGTKSTRIAEQDTGDLEHLAGYTTGEIAYLVKNEMATRLDDLLLRRTKTAWVGVLTKESVEELAEIMGNCLGWSVEEKQGEIKRALEILREKHAVNI